MTESAVQTPWRAEGPALACREARTRARRTVKPALTASSLLAICFAIALPAQAADGQKIVTEGNADGAPACFACHGEHGEGQPQLGYPRLAGLDPAYIVHQLQSFAEGTRTDDTMQPIAEALSPDEREAVASFYGSAQAAKAEGEEQANDEVLAAGAMLAERGDWSKQIPGCGQCHGPAGEGVGANFPALAGQSGTYIANQLHAWKDGQRANDPLGLMTGIASKLSDDEIAAASAYYASLPVFATPSEGQKGEGQ